MTFPSVEHLRNTSIPNGIPPSDNPAEVAWMAALFEGEGYIANPISRKNKKGGNTSALRIRFSMCDRDVLERFQYYAAGGRLSGPFPPRGIGKKETYSLEIESHRAYALLRSFWQWLGDRRKKQVTVAVVKWGEMRPQSEGIVLDPEKVKEIRARLAIGSHGIGGVLANEYGVSNAMISAIKHNRAWSI